MKKLLLLLAIASIMSCKKDAPEPYNTSPTKNPKYNGIHCTDQNGIEIPCPA